MGQPSAAAYLAEMRDALGQGEALTCVQRTELTRGFLTINLILDVAAFYHGLIHGWTTPLTPSVSYRTLGGWLEGEPPDAATLAAFVEQSAGQTQPAHPWRQLHRWLALETVLAAIRHRLPESQQAAPDLSLASAAQHAFEQLLHGGAYRPRVCRDRGSPVVGQFKRWWSEQGQALALWWQRDAERFRKAASRATLIEELAGTLLAVKWLDSTQRLLGAKETQLTTCLARMNEALPLPVPAGWLSGLAARLLAAAEPQPPDDLQLNRNDLEHLKTVALWLEGIGQKLNGPILEALVRNHEVQVPAHRVRDLLREFRRLFVFLRLRGVPHGLGSSRHVQDLFADPLAQRFAEWQRQASRYRYAL